MTIEDGHFRTDNRTLLEPCCKQMKISIELRHLKKTYLCKDGSAKVQVWVQCAGNKCNVWSWYDDISFCPFCGAKLEYVKKLEASQ